MNWIMSLAACLALVVALSSVNMADARTKPCEFQVHVKPEERHLAMGLVNFTKPSGKRHTFCTVLIRADPGNRVVLDLFYLPKKKRRGSHGKHINIDNNDSTDSRDDSSRPTSCTSDNYVHVGNDVRRVDVQLMTSYKFCDGRARHELVSRAHEMWLVYRASTSRPKELVVTIRAMRPVSCMPGQFTCSPVQCVDQARVCDGQVDCSNGHDEFCLAPGGANAQSTDSQPCFRCRDGTCIQPRLPRYDMGWGRGLWYLCDGFNHCSDGWDERPDVCVHLLKGRAGSVTECVPFDRAFGPHRKVILWNDVRCNDVTECFHGEDELRCRRSYASAKKLHAKPLTIGIIAAIVALALLVAVVIYRLQRRGRSGVRPSVQSAAETLCTQCTSVDGDESTSCGGGGSGSSHQHRSASCCSATVDAGDMAVIKASGVGDGGGYYGNDPTKAPPKYSVTDRCHGDTSGKGVCKSSVSGGGCHGNDLEKVKSKISGHPDGGEVTVGSKCQDRK